MREKDLVAVMAVDTHGGPVNHPAHYNTVPGIECIDVVEHFGFLRGNAIKYLWRADHKNRLQDLRKARWYIDREIENMEKG